VRFQQCCIWQLHACIPKEMQCTNSYIQSLFKGLMPSSEIYILRKHSYTHIQRCCICWPNSRLPALDMQQHPAGNMGKMVVCDQQLVHFEAARHKTTPCLACKIYYINTPSDDECCKGPLPPMSAISSLPRACASHQYFSSHFKVFACLGDTR